MFLTRGRNALTHGALALSALAACTLVAAALAIAPAAAAAATATLNTTVSLPDGTQLTATVTGQAPLSARPVIVEFTPYGPGTMTTADGSAYNYLLIQDRGTGDSPGQWDALGPQTQSDVQDTLAWACHQSWSNGNLGLNGFSASAITVYNSMHLALPCVRTAVLKSGTYSLYRDLLYPGGVNNFIPGAGVLALIGGAALAQGEQRLQPNPLTGIIDGFDTSVGLTDVGISDLQHPTLDSFWDQRQYQGDANHFPVLMLDSFYDVESQGAFEAFRALRGVGDHLLVVAGHDGSPAGTDGGVADVKDWFDHYLLGIDNGIQNQPRVQMLMSDGSRETYDNGRYVRYDASDWPVPGTRWMSLALSPTRSNTASSLNDGSLTNATPSSSTTQSYAAVPSVPTASDTPNAGFFGPDGLNAIAAAAPALTETGLSEPLGLTYTSAPLTQNVLSAGPAALDVRLSSTASTTNIWAVISDVWPDGSSHPVASGRLNTEFPGVDASQSLTDAQGQIVEPWNDFIDSATTTPGTERTYQLAFWPIGNEFQAGHRIRLTILGSSAASLPSLPAVNSVRVGGVDGSKLLLPVLPAAASSCATATTSAIKGRTIGPLRLGMTRAKARRALRQACRGSGEIRASYATRRLLSELPRRARVRYRGRIVMLLTRSSHYTLRGIRPGKRLRGVQVKGAVRERLGSITWYLLPGAGSRGIVESRRGVVLAVGIADLTFTHGRRAALRLLRSA